MSRSYEPIEVPLSRLSHPKEHTVLRGEPFGPPSPRPFCLIWLIFSPRRRGTGILRTAMTGTVRKIAASELATQPDVLELRRGGAIETQLRIPLESIADLRRAYTPGVAVACERIAADPASA